MRTVVNVVLLLAAIALVALNVFLRIDPSRRHFELFPQMAHSVPYDTFAANPNFADGKTLRPLPAGTVVRGAMPLHFKATPADAQRAAIELVSNVRANDAKAVARGKWVFEQYCQTCHGPFGKGDGIVATRGFPMPASLIAPRAVQMRDGQMFHVITYGQGNMPSHAAQVARNDRWNAIAYVRTLQKAAPPVVATTPLQSNERPPLTLTLSPQAGRGDSSSPVPTVVPSRTEKSYLPDGGERVRVRGQSSATPDPGPPLSSANPTQSSAKQSPLPAGGERVRVRGQLSATPDPGPQSSSANPTQSSAKQSPLPASGERVRVRGQLSATPDPGPSSVNPTLPENPS